MQNFLKAIVFIWAISASSGILQQEEAPVAEAEGIQTIERVNLRTNKTVKILTGQRPMQQQQQSQPPSQYLVAPSPAVQYPGPHQQQQQQQQYPQSPNYHPQYYPPQYSDQSGQASGPQPIAQQPQVPEIYLQIIGAIEKLVERFNGMEARVQTLENVVLHLTKAKPEQGNCPEKFIKVEGIRGKCFHLSTLRQSSSPSSSSIITPGNELFDWQSANGECNKLGGRLAEMLHYEDFHRMSKFLVKFAKSGSNTNTQDIWIGGINPGLIWIWKESGQKVQMDTRFWNDHDNSSGAPGCLKLSYSHRLDAYFFKGAPCSHSVNILCEIMDNTARALASYEENEL